MATKTKTLVAYATKSGVTEEAARIIAGVLQEKYNLNVDTVNLCKKPKVDITAYQNIIIGSGVRMGRWYKEALGLLKNNYEGKNVVIFLSSCMAGNPDKHDEAKTKYIDDVLKRFPHIKPLAAEAFGGRMRMLGKTIEDNCDMEKVQIWAREVGAKIVKMG